MSSQNILHQSDLVNVLCKKCNEIRSSVHYLVKMFARYWSRGDKIIFETFMTTHGLLSKRSIVGWYSLP